MKKLVLECKHVYGAVMMYPHCEFSKLLCKLLTQKTLTKKNIDLLKEAGYEIEYVPWLPK